MCDQHNCVQFIKPPVNETMIVVKKVPKQCIDHNDINFLVFTVQASYKLQIAAVLLKFNEMTTKIFILAFMSNCKE